MPKYQFNKIHINVGLETELNVTVNGQGLVYDTVLLRTVKEQTVGAVAIPYLTLAVDHPNAAGTTGRLEVKTAPFAVGEVKLVAPKLQNVLVAVFRASGPLTLANFATAFNGKLAGQGLSNDWKLTVEPGANPGITLRAGKDGLNKGQQVNVSLPFIDLCNPAGFILSQDWPGSKPGNDSMPKKKFRAAVACANKLADRVAALHPGREMRKVRSLLTLFFFNSFIALGAGGALNKDSWTWLPKITIDDAKYAILSADDRLALMDIWRAAQADQFFFKTTFKATLDKAVTITTPKWEHLKKRLRRLLYVAQVATPQEQQVAATAGIYGHEDPDSWYLGESMTGKPIDPYHGANGHKKSDAMVVFEIRKIGENPAAFAHQFGWNMEHNK